MNFLFRFGPHPQDILLCIYVNIPKSKKKKSETQNASGPKHFGQGTVNL
jgi:hypothetical protein